MKIKSKKTQFILFNPAKSLNFMPDFCLQGKPIELVEQMKVLGLTLRSDMKWCSNTLNVVVKGFKRLWILRRLKQYEASSEELLDIYSKQVRSVLELAVPVWHSSITMKEKYDLERVQRRQEGRSSVPNLL